MIGLDYRTAPLALRERLYLSPAQQAVFLASIDQPAVILSTCNRLEIYAGDVESLLGALCRYFGMDVEPCLTQLTDHAAIVHLMRVACGLESLALGETEILGQVGDALQRAQAVQATDSALHRLFTQAIHAGKRARHETAISHHTTSISHVAAHLVGRHTQVNPRVVIIGAGEMAELAIQALRSQPISTITLVNRTYDKAVTLATRWQVEAKLWSSLWQVIEAADVVITATGAPHAILEAPEIAQVMTQRQQRPLTLIDIAVPRNVAPEVRALPQVNYYDLDHLQQVIDDHWAERQGAIPAVEAIIAEECAKFQQWLEERTVIPVIKDLRAKVEGVVQTELDDLLQRLDHLSESEKRLLERFAHRVVNKLLHPPTTYLRAHQEDADVVRELFAI
jgi:glutamyl-tRNA reductase